MEKFHKKTAQNRHAGALGRIGYTKQPAFPGKECVICALARWRDWAMIIFM